MEPLTVTHLGPRHSPAASYFKRTNPPESEQDATRDSDLLKSIKQVVRPARSHEKRRSILYPCSDPGSPDNRGMEQELVWNDKCVVLSTGGVILRKWTFENEDQGIQWACKGVFEQPGGIAEGPAGSFAAASANEAYSPGAASSSTFSSFARSAQARQRAVEPPKLLPAIFIFLRNLGKIYVEGGADYTFHVPFLVHRAWPLRPHGVLVQRKLSDAEILDASRGETSILPTLFTLHDPFAEFKVVGLASRIHGAFGPALGATAITQPDPDHIPETKTPEDFSTAEGYVPTPVRAMQANPGPPPPKPERPPPLQKPPPTDGVIWVSEEITTAPFVENIVVTLTPPLRYSHPQSGVSTPPHPEHSSAIPGPKPIPHRHAHKAHLSIWRYAYFKPREVPNPVKSRHKRSTPSGGNPVQTPAEPPISTTPTPQRDPDASRRRELQDRADRIAPSSPSALQTGGSNNDPFAAQTSRQPVGVGTGAQPTLASLPGGELPASWGHPPPERPTTRRKPSISVTMDRMDLGAEVVQAEIGAEDRKKNQRTDTEKSPATFMSAGHMKMQPSVWFEKISAIPIPSEDIWNPERISVHLFDTRSDGKLDRSRLAVHFPAAKVVAIYPLARVPSADTFRLYPAIYVEALSVAPVVAFRQPILDLLVVKPDNSLGVLTHGIRMVDIKIGPYDFPLSFKSGTAYPPVDDAMVVDELASTGGDVGSDTSMHSVIDRAKIVAVSEPLHSGATVRFMDGSTTRINFTFQPRDALTAHCFYALSYALTSPRAFSLQQLWLEKWTKAGRMDNNDEEWTCFVDAFCQLMGIQSPYEAEREGENDAPPGSWDALAYSASHDRLEKDLMFMSMDTPSRAPRSPIEMPKGKPHEDIVPCLLALHTLGESLKLKLDAIHSYLPRLARLLIAMGRAVRPEWADHWVRLYPDNVEGWADPKRQDVHIDSRLRPQPPDIYGYLFTRLVEPQAKSSWSTLAHISHLFSFEASMEYGRIDPIIDLYRIFSVWECFADTSVPTARKRAENAMQIMVRIGMTLDELDQIPYGVAQPIREALRTCQSVPSGDWSVRAYQLISRPDLAQMVSGDSTHIPSRDSFRQVDKHLDPSVARRTVGEILEEAHAAMSPEPASVSGVDLDLGDFTDIRFGSDRRLQEVARMLQSSSPAVVKMPERHDLTEHEVAREQQTTALRVAERTLALPVGRAMFTFGSVPTVTRDAYQIPKMEFSVRLQPYNALVAVDISKMNSEAKNWADFHNGVATGLRMSPSSKMVDSSWITFNKPAELTAQHAGFLFGLGLSGHLKNMMTWHTFAYLTPKHDLTSIGVLLGLSAAHVGTANRHVTKLLAVHTPALLPNPSIDLNVPMLTQASGLVGIGLLYTGTQNRRMAEVALHEISRTQVTSADQTTDHREAYSLSAALSFGMIMLSAGATTSSPADMNMVARLRLLIHGEPMLPGNKANKPSFDVTLTSAPASLALALMFLKTGRADIADILAVPTTLLELHHLQPSFLLVRTLGRALIMWDDIVATPQWVTDQLPKSALEALEKRMQGRPIDESQELAYFNIVSGACFAMGLKFAGTAQEDPYSCLLHFHDLFTRISNQNSGQFDHRIKRAAVRDGLNLMSLALAMVMAGTGEINCLRRFRFSHGQAIQPARYGVHMATHMAIGMLFLGGGRSTLGTSDSAIACLLAAFYPRFPTLSHENRGHLQALRHLWVLAVEPRCLIGRDVDSREVVYLPVKVKLKAGSDTRSAQLISPTLFPDIDRLLFIRVDTPRYFAFFLDVANNPRHREALLRSQTLWVKRRTGHLGYGEDPRGSRSIYVRSGASSGDAAVLDNPKPSDAKSASAGEFYNFISSFSNEAFFVAFVDRFCRNDYTNDRELTLSAFSHAALLECLTLDRAHLLPTYLSVHLARSAPPWAASTLAVRDLAWLDEFYKNVYDPRFSGKGDNAPMPPLMRRSLLLAAERTVDQQARALRGDPELQAALRLYHRGEGLAPGAAVRLRRSVAFYVTRTNAPPASVLVQMRAEAEAAAGATRAELAAAGKAGPAAERAVNRVMRGLLWNTGVLFAGGILRPWSVRALEEVIGHWGL